MLQYYHSFTRLQLVAALNDISQNMLADEVYVKGFHVPKNCIQPICMKDRLNHTNGHSKKSPIHV